MNPLTCPEALFESMLRIFTQSESSQCRSTGSWQLSVKIGLVWGLREIGPRRLQLADPWTRLAGPSIARGEAPADYLQTLKKSLVIFSRNIL